MGTLHDNITQPTPSAAFEIGDSLKLLHELVPAYHPRPARRAAKSGRAAFRRQCEERRALAGRLRVVWRAEQRL